MTEHGKQKLKTITEDTLMPLTIVCSIAVMVFYLATYAAKIDKVEAHQKIQDEKIESVQDIKTDIAVIKQILQDLKRK